MEELMGLRGNYVAMLTPFICITPGAAANCSRAAVTITPHWLHHHSVSNQRRTWHQQTALPSPRPAPQPPSARQGGPNKILTTTNEKEVRQKYFCWGRGGLKKLTLSEHKRFQRKHKIWRKLDGKTWKTSQRKPENSDKIQNCFIKDITKDQ